MSPFFRLNRKATLTVLFLLFCFFHFPGLIAQQQLRAAYPVQVTAFLPTPYSLNLEEYCSGSKPRLLVTLLNRDLMEPDLQVRLRLSIKAGGGSVLLQTVDYNSYPAIRLSPGVPYQLTMDDLCPYFRGENLVVQGAMPGGRLPEGMIEMCISAVEVYTSRVVSQTGCARAWVTLNRPPLLNLPVNGALLPFRDPLNVLFQWTPRHQGLSNVEYEFSLREILDTGIAPEGAFDYSPLVYSSVVRSTSLAYTGMMPPLVEGNRYAWQVRAVVRDGFEELGLFENRGYSEIHSFSLSPGCNPPAAVSHHQETGHLVVEFTPASASGESVVAYHSAVNPASPWVVVRSNSGRANIFDLVFDHEYEYKVGTVCTDGSVVYGEVHRAVLSDWKKDLKANCGVAPVINLSNKEPLPLLRAGDVFMAGDFPVTVSRAEGKGGTFSGLGWTRIPFMASVKVAMKFEGIRINTDYRMIGGYVESAYDKHESQVADGDRLWHGGDQTGQTVTGAVECNVRADFSIPEGAVVVYDPAGKLVVTDRDGKGIGEVVVPEKDRGIFTSGEPYTYTIQDKDGKIHTVTGDGKGNTSVTQTGSQGKALSQGSFSETAVADKKAIVEFQQGEGANYAFDTWKDYYKTVSLIANKQKYEFLGGYAVPCKLIPPGKTDKVGFKVSVIDKRAIKADSIVFKTKGGYEVKPVDGQLTLTGGKANDAQDLYALYPDGKGGYWTLGKLKVLSYSEPVFNVVLVPVRDSNTGEVSSTDPGSVERELQQTYGQLGIGWNVTMDELFDYSSVDLNSGGSDLFSKYSDEMKALNSAYREFKGKLDSKTVYIFVLRSGNIKNTLLSGDMPRGGQFGYVFTQSGDLPRTIAHELGHGKFRLRHTFDGEYGSTAKATEGRTENLMDYGSGTELAKWQWDEVFDPAMLVNPFESDGEGMAITRCNAQKPKEKGSWECEKKITTGYMSSFGRDVTDCSQTWYYHTGIRIDALTDPVAADWYREEDYLKLIAPAVKGLIICDADDDLFVPVRDSDPLDVSSRKYGYISDFQNYIGNDHLDDKSFEALITDRLASKVYSDLRVEIQDIYDRKSGRIESVSPEFELMTLGLGSVIKKISINFASKVSFKGLTSKAFYLAVRQAMGKETKEGIARQSWNGFANIFKANTDEIVEAAVKIKNYRATNNLKGGNFGYLEGTVNGKVIDNKIWRSVSSAQAESETHIFNAIEAEGAGGNAWIRITDTEYRMLNNLSNDLGAVKGGKYPSITGELKIVSENPYCNSCQGIIQQFNEMYPNIKLILVDGTK